MFFLPLPTCFFFFLRETWSYITDIFKRKYSYHSPPIRSDKQLLNLYSFRLDSVIVGWNCPVAPSCVLIDIFISAVSNNKADWHHYNEVDNSWKKGVVHVHAALEICKLLSLLIYYFLLHTMGLITLDPLTDYINTII